MYIQDNRFKQCADPTDLWLLPLPSPEPSGSDDYPPVQNLFQGSMQRLGSSLGTSSNHTNTQIDNPANILQPAEQQHDHESPSDSSQFSQPQPVQQLPGTTKEGPCSKMKEKLKDKYLLAMETIERQYPSSSEQDIVRISHAIQAGSNCVRRKPGRFIKAQLASWLREGLWPKIPAANSQDIMASCSLDMLCANITRQAETTRMVHRLARVRLFHWYEMCMEEVKHNSEVHCPGTNHRQATEKLLERFYDNWRVTPEEVKQSHREKFDSDRSIGKKWCYLAHYYSPGILVIAGNGMDTQMLL